MSPADFIGQFGFWVLGFGAPVLGYALAVIDYRKALRSLSRALVIVRGYRTELPEWVRRTQPECLKALGLSLPCTKGEVLAAYRARVKEVHPDVGGSRKEFERLQRYLEQALELAS
jgi:hypothetical protein